MASSSLPAKTHAPLSYYYSDLPFKWGKDSKRRRSARSSQQNKSPTVRTTPPPLPPPPGFSPRRDISPPPGFSRRRDIPPPPGFSPRRDIPPPPGFSPCRDSPIRDTTAIRINLPPPPRRDSPPPRPPQHRRYNSPHRDSLSHSIDCSVKPSLFSRHGSSSGPFFQRDSQSEARPISMSHSRNYHHHQGSEESNLHSQGGTDQKHEKTIKVEEGDVSGVKRSSKILIKIPWKKIKSVDDKRVEKKSADKKPAEAEKAMKKKNVVEEVEKKNVCDGKEESEINNEEDDKTKEQCEIKEEAEIRDEDDKIDEGGEIRDEGDKIVEEGEKSPRIDEEGEKNPKMEEEVRVWNSRLRKPISKGNGGENKAPSTSKNAEEEKKPPQKVKVSLSVALTKQEIEEDFFAWTGAKPPRRPQKRAKHVQKLLDSLFPGLHLTGISVDSYK